MHTWHKLLQYMKVNEASCVCLASEHGRVRQSQKPQSFRSVLVEQQSRDVVTITFYLCGALGTVEINIGRYRLDFLTMLSLPPEN